MKNYIQDGEVINITATAELTSGVATLVGSLLAVPVTDIADGDTGAACIQGVVELPKLKTADIKAGDRLTWDVSAGKVIVAAAAVGDLENCAVATADAGTDATSVQALLAPGAGAVKAA